MKKYMSTFLTAISLLTLVVGVYLNKVGTNAFAPREVEAPSVLSESDEKEEVLENSSLEINFIYPNARILQNSPTYLSLSSLDTLDEISSWYENKLIELGFKSDGVTQTKLNEDTLNSFSGSQGSDVIYVEVREKFGEKEVSIIVRK